MTQRIRGRTRQEIRRQVLERQPLCVLCLEKKPQVIRLAVEVDHVVAIKNGGEDSLDPFVNRQGLCVECHEEKTRKDLGYREVTKFGPDGWPVA